MAYAHTGNLNENEKWMNNEAHGGLYGVYMNKDGLAGCSLIQGFFIWRNFDFGIYFQVHLFIYLQTLFLNKGRSSYFIF